MSITSKTFQPAKTSIGPNDFVLAGINPNDSLVAIEKKMRAYKLNQYAKAA